ncbi:hypothetical protein [Actinomyces vulturis]|uniref:variant leucine-rich repeat-containing protein n=1 Tax=Actinomyces vulturis TaxID=1857645 RepID=UPI00082C37DC|nr:hypothetical protein [Actinomyces vulturis]
MTTSGVDRDAQRAADPSTPAGALMVLAGIRPDLRAVIAKNPSCSDDLQRWIEQTPVDVLTDSEMHSWAPAWSDNPFGSVAGDPLMGSPLDDSGIIPADAVPDDSSLPSLSAPPVSHGHNEQRQAPQNYAPQGYAAPPAHGYGPTPTSSPTQGYGQAPSRGQRVPTSPSLQRGFTPIPPQGLAYQPPQTPSGSSGKRRAGVNVFDRDYLADRLVKLNEQSAQLRSEFSLPAQKPVKVSSGKKSSGNSNSFVQFLVIFVIMVVWMILH